MELQQILHAAHVLVQTPIMRGAITGLAGAALVDYSAFRAWKSWGDLATYDWRTATWRWCQGAIVGAVAGVGLNAVV